MKRINILITDEQHKELIYRVSVLEKSVSEQIRNSIDSGLTGYNKIDRFVNLTPERPLEKKCVRCGIVKNIALFDEKKGLNFTYYSDCIECNDKFKRFIK